MPVQEPGLRLARPLPYNLAVDAKVTLGQVELDFANFGSVGAAFHVVSSTDATGPWEYTVSAGKKLTGKWAVGSGYAYEVHGPNGFLREVNGSGPVNGLDVTARHLGSGRGEVLLSFVNHAEYSIEITLTDAYGNQGGHATLPGASGRQLRAHRAHRPGQRLVRRVGEDLQRLGLPAPLRRARGDRPAEHQRPGHRHLLIHRIRRARLAHPTLRRASGVSESRVGYPSTAMIRSASASRLRNTCTSPATPPSASP